jgi:hypothetical protein
LSATGVNAKTGSGVRFNQCIDSDLRGFTRQTSSLQTFNSNAQNCHNKINTYFVIVLILNRTRWFLSALTRNNVQLVMQHDFYYPEIPRRLQYKNIQSDKNGFW